MSWRSRLAFAALVALALTVALVSVRVAWRYRGASVELRRQKVSELTPAMKERIARLDADVLITWYGSAKERMPADYRHIEASLGDLLRALQADSKGRIQAQIVDPGSDPSLSGYLASLGVSPFRARRVERDGYVEESLWSCLRIVYGAHGAAVIPALRPSELPHAQALIAAHLDQLEKPRRPRIGVAAPHSFVALRRELASRADVYDSDFDASASIRDDVDLLFWIDPTQATGAHVAALQAFLEHGKSAVIAGSDWQAELESKGGAPAVRFSKTGFPAEALFSEFGLRLVPGLVLDARAEGASPMEKGARGLLATHLVSAIGEEQDFRSLSGQPNGSLLFAVPTPFEPDAPRLTELDLSATVLATSSESTWSREFVNEPLPLADLQTPEAGQRLSREPLLAILRPADPWRGSLVFAASSSPFGDAYFKHEAYAHAMLARILIASLASSERIAQQRVALTLPARLPELSTRQRWTARGLVVLALPLALLAIAFARGARRSAARGSEDGRPRGMALTAGAALAFAAIALLAALSPAAASLDLTRDRSNSLADGMRAVLAGRARPERPVSVRLIFSPDGDLPPEMRPLVRGARDLVRAMSRASPDVSASDVDTATASEAVLAGVRRERVTSSTDEVTTVRRIYCAIEVSRGGRTERLVFPSVESFNHLEFRLAFALDRLSRERRVKVAFAADTPRLSPAEAQMEYEKKGLFAPSRGDAYGNARALLEQNDFEIAAVDPEKPDVPQGSDLLVWLQPRRDVKPMLTQAVERLAGGGKVLIAAQHYVVRSQKRAKNDFSPSWWPEPQFCDLDVLYFPRIGIELRREVLLDDRYGTLPVDTKIQGEERAQIVREQATSPLFIRASAASFDPESPIVRGLSDPLMPCANRIVWDGPKTVAAGMRGVPLVFSSERTWIEAWTGGDLPESILRGPHSESGVARDSGYIGRQPLAVLFHGSFPRPWIDEKLAPRPEKVIEDDLSTSSDGTLLFIGCSEMFQDGRLRLPGYRHDRFLLQGVAGLCLPDDLASILAHRREQPGFDDVEPRTRLWLRAFVLGAAPVALLAFGLVWQIARRRAPLRIAPDARAGAAQHVEGI